MTGHGAAVFRGCSTHQAVRERTWHAVAPPSHPEGHAARFSRCRRYRWWLRRRWRQAAPTLLFIGLNPSSADGRRDDPTLRRLIGFADGWGYGAVEVVNLFAWISADPIALRRAAQPVGPQAEAWIRRRVRQLHRGHAGASAGAGQPGDPDGGQTEALLPLWLGWGNGGAWRGRDRQMLQLLKQLPVRLFCLGRTAAGQPRHPLYVRHGSPLVPFAASWEDASAPHAAPCPARRAATRSI